MPAWAWDMLIFGLIIGLPTALTAFQRYLAARRERKRKWRDELDGMAARGTLPEEPTEGER